MSAGILSLCTGYGGLDLAVEAVTGARTVAVSDLDKGANKILAHRFGRVPNLGDLKLIDWSPWIGTYAMTAGYPCQPFSGAGLRKGTDDPRHIFPYIADAIRIVGPQLVVLENVRGHLRLGFDVVLGALADIGYDARWVLLPASGVGAPHPRLRLFIAATPNASRQRHGGWQDGRGLGRLDGPHEGGPRERERSREVTGDRGVAAAPDAGRRQLAGTAAATDGLRLASERPSEYGEYSRAVARWEAVLRRPAPAPTADGRVNTRFVEWMMGLPDGWVTDVPGLSYEEQRKALGNGVVPQQAAAALTFLLNTQAVAA